MAHKLFLVSATLAFFFLLTNASIYRTIVEFDEQTPAGPIGPKERLCTRDFRQSQHLRACQQWVHKQAQQGPQLYLEGDDFENPQGQQQRPPLLQKCCQELHQESPVCVCPTLEEVARAVKIQGQQGPGQQGYLQTRRIYQTAKNLPNVCNIPNVNVCPFQVIPSYY